MNKIIVIGQAPPATKQTVPYDTTQLYDWLQAVGISKEKAQDMFEFEAVYNKFPGWNMGQSHTGGHRKPTIEQMNEYWPILREKVLISNKIWILGNVAADYLLTKDEINGKLIMKTIHPSNMTKNIFNKNKESILQQIKNFIWE